MENGKVHGKLLFEMQSKEQLKTLYLIEVVYLLSTTKTSGSRYAGGPYMAKHMFKELK